MTRVLHVDAGRELRGGQRQMLSLVTRIGGAVAIRADAPLRPALEAAGVEVIPIRFRGRWWGTAALWAEIRRRRPELVAAHDGHGAAHALRCGAPVVVHRRVDFAPSRLGALRYRRAAGVIAVSGAVARVMRGVGVERVRVVHDGVDPGPIDAATPDRAGIRAELGLPLDRTLICAVGALVDHKAHHLMVRALADLPGVTGVILGEGPLGPSLRELAVALGVDLRLVGWRADVGRWLKSADVFVHPSVEEGLGQAVIEAAFAGIPMVVSQAGGLPELGLGIPVAPGDVPGLGDAIQRVIGGSPAIERAVLAERFGADRMARETLEAYHRFLDGLGRR